MKYVHVLSIFVVGLSGCAMWDPGGQVRRGLSQSKIYEWRKNGSFWVEGNGPQTERFTMAQGDIKIGTNAEGEEYVDWENSRLEFYLHADPSADAAASAMTQALQASTQQVQMVSESFNKMMEMLGPLIQARLAPQGGGGDEDGNDLRNLIRAEILKALQERGESG